MKRLFFLLLIGFLFTGCAHTNTGIAGPIACADENKNIQLVKDGAMSIHFLELGNKYTGDCIYINYGNIDILIDAGSRTSSAVTIKEYIDQFCKDGILEYVIATHAHQDHIAAFCSTASITGILDAYKIGTIIDFPLTNSASAISRNYVNTRNRLVEAGTSHFTALQCYNNEGNARRIYDFSGGVKMEILYNYFYENQTKDENNYSVCLMIIHNNRKFLFTGDLEADGEYLLVDYYKTHHGGLGHCVLYKGAHHGSNTSSGEVLMAAITPEYICVCTCAGTTEYKAAPANVFPSQDFIFRTAPYTDKIYLTTLIKDYSRNDYSSYNGNIIFWASNDTITVQCSADNQILKNSEWFLKNRIMPDPWK